MKVKLWAAVNLVGTEQVEYFDFPDDTTEEELEEEARNFLTTMLDPDYGFVILEGNHYDHDCEQEGCE